MSLTRLTERLLAPGSDDRSDVVRFAFFGVLAVDIWFGIEHLARYGAGHFNVSHLPFLDGLIPAPERSWMVGLALVQVVLAVRAALGVQLRVTVPALTALYSVSYFWSQLDSYQHHYLLAVLLGVFSGGLLLERGAERIPPWALRLVMAVVALMYGWAAITKLDPEWLGGRTLGAALTDEGARDLVLWLAEASGTGHLEVLGWASIAALVGEVFLAVALLVRRTRTAAWGLGVAFHLGIEWADLRIGLFSWFMVGLYFLYAPDGVVRRLAPGVRKLAPISKGDTWWPTILAAFTVAAGVTWLPFEGSWAAGLVAAGFIVVSGAASQRGLPVLLAPAGVLLLLHVGTDTAREYYKYWGGDTRRRGPLVEAIHAYEQVVALDPDYPSGHLRLGDLYLRDGRQDEAVAAWRRVLEVEPGNTTAAARLQQHGATD